MIQTAQNRKKNVCGDRKTQGHLPRADQEPWETGKAGERVFVAIIFCSDYFAQGGRTKARRYSRNRKPPDCGTGKTWRFVGENWVLQEPVVCAA